jgi:hypothetical protein
MLPARLSPYSCPRAGLRDQARARIAEEWPGDHPANRRDHDPGLITELRQGGCARAPVRDHVPGHYDAPAPRPGTPLPATSHAAMKDHDLRLLLALRTVSGDEYVLRMLILGGHLVTYAYRCTERPAGILIFRIRKLVQPDPGVAGVERDVDVILASGVVVALTAGGTYPFRRWASTCASIEQAA